MKICPGTKPYLIYLNHSNKKFEAKLKKIILENIHNIEVKTFKVKSEILQIDDIIMADLIITDLLFCENSLNKFRNNIHEIYQKPIIVPFLLLTKGNEFDSEKISFINDFPDLIFDFVNEDLFHSFLLINRIKVLLNIPRIVKVSNVKAEHLQMNLWKLLDYSNFFAIILDSNLKIKTINYHLSKILGYGDQSALINEDWVKFLKPTEIDVIKYVHEQITNNNKDYNEFTNDIIDSDKNIITVKWFNTLINHNYNWVFSIGVPLTKEPTLNEDIDSIRSYFRDILEQDKTTINAMREVAKKNSTKFLKDNERK